MATAYFSGDSRYYIDYNVTLVSQEVNNNRSKIRRTLVMHKATGSGDYSGTAVSHWATWGPTTHGWHYFTFNFTSYTSLTLMNHEEWVGHNNDGTLTFHSSAQVNADLSTGTPSNRQASVGFNVTLPTIPRATTPNITGGGGFTTGTATTINLPRAASGFTHDVSYSIGTKSGTIATGAGVTASWTPPHTLMTELPNAASGQVKVTVVTKNGSTTIGTKEVNFSLTAGSSVVPTVSGVTWDDNNTTVKTNIGAFVQGLSLVKGAVTAAGVHGSTIASKSIVIGGQTFPENTAFLVNGSGTISATGQATDSRGRTNTLATSFSVLPYLPPQVGSNGWQVRRANSSNVVDDNGQYLRIDLHITATSLTVGTQKNALRISVRTRPLNGSWTQRNVVNPGLTQNGAIQVSGGGAFLNSQSYEVEITITDNTSAPAMVLKKTVGTSVVTLDLRDSRVGVGKMHENGQLDVAGDVYATNMRAAENVYSGGAILDPIGSAKLWFTSSAPQGWLLLQGQAVSRTTYAALFTLLGTTYGAGDGSTTFNLPDMRGSVPVGFTTTDTEFNALGKKFGTKTHTLTMAEMPAHNHGGVDKFPSTHPNIYTGNAGGGGINMWSTGYVGADAGIWSSNFSHEHKSEGGGGAHNNIQPSIALNFIIRAL